MNYYVAGIPVSDELYHHGIKGQKWGIQRYQNEDGTLTAEGRTRYRKAAAIEDLNYPHRAVDRLRLDKIQKQMLKSYIKGLKRQQKYETKASNAKEGTKKKMDHMAEGKAYTRKLLTLKAMSNYYSNLEKGTKREIRNAFSEKIAEGQEAAYSYLNNQLLRMKVQQDKQSGIWDRT